MNSTPSSPLQDTQQIILEEDWDPNFDPTEDEIREYAIQIGMDPDKEPHLLWIARDTLKAPLPDKWKPCQAPDGNVYYFNFETGESIWEHPLDESCRKLYEKEKEKQPTAPISFSVHKSQSVSPPPSHRENNLQYSMKTSERSLNSRGRPNLMRSVDNLSPAVRASGRTPSPPKVADLRSSRTSNAASHSALRIFVEGRSDVKSGGELSPKPIGSTKSCDYDPSHNNEQFEQIKAELEKEYRKRQVAEENKIRLEFENQLAAFKKEQEEKLRKQMSEDVKKYENQVDDEIVKIRQEFAKKRQELLRQHEQEEQLEKQRFQQVLDRMNQELQEKKNALEQEHSRYLNDIKIRHQQELDAERQKRIRDDVQLQNVDQDFQSKHDRLAAEWGDRITTLRTQIEVEEAELQRTLAKIQQQQQDEKGFLEQLKAKRKEQHVLEKENDELFEKEKKRREFLLRERASLDQLEKDVELMRQRIESERAVLNAEKQKIEQKKQDYTVHTSPVPSVIPSRSPEPVKYGKASSGHTTDVRIVPDYPDKPLTLSVLEPADVDLDDLDDLRLDPSLLSENIPEDLRDRLNHEMSHLSKAKADIREQRAAIRERQRQLEHDRQHWKSELDVVATKLSNFNLNAANFDQTGQTTSAPSDAVEDAFSDEAMDPKELERIARLQGDLSKMVDQLRKSQVNLDQPETDRLHKPTSFPFKNQWNPRATYTGPIVIHHRQPTFRSTNYDYSSLSKSRGYGFKDSITNWDEEQRKSDEILRNHSRWLHRFRQQMGLERTGTSVRATATLSSPDKL